MSGAKKHHRMTDAQARSTHPQVTAWVGASAGTGKTHVLTARVLRLMLTGTPPENIVCLTFTKAAAAEMVNRIFAELGRWTMLPDSDLAEVIHARTDEHADADMLARARRLFAQVLDLAGGLQIQTFHSFCQALLGRFPLEAGMTPGFEGLDDTAAADLMAFSKDQMLAATREPLAVELQQALDIVAGLVTERTFDEVIARIAYEAPMLGRATRAYGGREGLMRALYQRLGADPSGSDAMIISAACAPGMCDEVGLSRLAAALATGTKTDQARSPLIADWLAAEPVARARLFADYLGAFVTKAGTPIKRVATKKPLEAEPDLAAVIETEQERLMAVEDQRRRQRAASATAALLRLGVEQLRLYRRQKTERGLVDFDDMIDRTIGLFSQPAAAPWILYKLDNRIDHILVDEAQDTNRDQWRVVETLAAEFFAGEGAREETRTVFAVGDAKQSIFSFQRADPREFVEARDRIFARAEAAGARAERVPLSVSFRSGEAVLSLVDSVFAADGMAHDGLSADGELIDHRFVRTGHAGRVELWPLEAAARDAEDETALWDLPVRQETAADAEQRAAWRIARHIFESVGKRELEAQGRSVRPGDILVLVRRRTAFVDHLVRALKSMGIAVAGRDRMVLTEELPVMDLIAAVRFAVLPTDDLALATLLKSPLFGLDDTALFALAHGRTGSLWQAIAARRTEADIAPVHSQLTALLNRADRGGPFDFISFLLNDLDGRRKLAARLGDEVHDPVDELLDEALRFELTRPASLLGFVEQLERAQSQLKRDMEQAGDRVRIMTTHSAKGLQAPIVYLSDVVSLPDMSKDSRLLAIPGDGPGEPSLPVWASQGRGIDAIEAARDALKARQLAEYRRLLYVALTRAEDELYVAGWRGPQEPDEHCWYRLIEDGFDRLGAQTRPRSDGAEIRTFSVAQSADVPPAAAGAARPAHPPLPDWLKAPMPAEPSPSRPLSPSRPEDDPPVTGPLARRADQRFRRGTLLHTLLQWLPELPEDKRESAAMAYLARTADIAPDARDAFWREVAAVLTHPELAPVFAPGSRAEVPVAGLVPMKSGAEERAISGQVDRLAFDGERVLIVDYKTNRPPPTRAEDIPAAYLRQMGLYARALAAVYPGKEIVAALLWTDAARLMVVPPGMMESALDAAAI